MITKQNFGKHENVTIATFGDGSVKFTRAKWENEENESMLLFNNNTEPRNVGDVSNEDAGKTSDELPVPEFILEFKNPESITALIHSLIELQKEVFKDKKQ